MTAPPLRTAYVNGMSDAASNRTDLEREAHLNVLIAANRFTSQMEKICRQHGLGHQHYVPLLTLCLSEHSRHGLPTGELNEGLLRPASDTTRLVDHLIREELAERLDDPADRRRVLVRATPKGRRVFKELTVEIQQFHRDQWSALDRSELRQLDQLLHKVLWRDETAGTDQQR